MSGQRVVSFAVICIVLYELLSVYVFRAFRRRQIFNLATQKAIELGLPLVVIGDPATDNYSLSRYDYGCGDLCVDIAGCPKCHNSITHDINKPFNNISDNSCVVFISCTLEYVNNIGAVVAELNRISGNNLYVVNIEPFTIKSLFFTNTGYTQFSRKWRVINAPPLYNNIKYIKI